MKNGFLLFLLILQCNCLVSQSYFVGDTSCNYVRVNRILYGSTGTNTTSIHDIYIDPNPDIDIRILDFFYRCTPIPSGPTCGGSTWEVKHLDVTSQSNTEFVYGSGVSATCSSSSMIKNVPINTQISSSLSWSLTPTSYNPTNFPNGVGPYTVYNDMGWSPFITALIDCGTKTDSFYVAFRKILPSSDTIYGWILLDSNLPHKVISYAFKRFSAPIVPIFTNTLTTVCVGSQLTLSANPSYGLFNGVGVSGNTFNAIGLSPGIYHAYASNGCTNADTLDISVVLCDVGVHENENYNLSINISPNPASDKLKITIENYSFSQKYRLSIISSNGRLVKSLFALKPDNEIVIEELSSGIYSIEIDSGVGIARKKLVIIK